MADVDIDALRIEIESDAQKASSGLDALIEKLEAIETKVKASTNLQNVAMQLEAIAKAVSGIQGGVQQKLNDLAEGIKKLNGVKLNKTSANAISSFATAASGLATVSTDGVDLGFFSQLNGTLAGLTNMSGVNSLAKALEKLPTVVENLRATNLDGVTEKITTLATSLSSLSGLSASGFSTSIKQLEKIPKVVEQLNDQTIAQFAEGIKKIADAMQPLYANSQNATVDLNALMRIMRQYNTTVRQTSESTRTLSKRTSLLGKLFASISIHKIGDAMSALVAKSNKYVEDLNLFTASMGEFADQAKEYAETVAGIVGIDPADWLRNQGIFQTLSTGFGVAADRAYIMSKNITQLGYDISSFFNIDVASAMQKLQSGLSGELEPLRRLGYDLSQARLSAIALSLGIDKAFTSMTQAEKAQLRYYAIMTQVTVAQGDMARTLNAPSNQLRILKAQLEQAGRAIGNIFIPMLNKILPVAIAVMKVIRGIADAIANLFGFELPEIDYSTLNVSGVTDSANDASAALDGATASAKELKKTILGLDEINPLNGITGSSGGSGGGAGTGVGDMSGFDFELPEYDFLAGLVESKVDAIFAKLQDGIKWIKDHIDLIAGVVGGVLATLIAYKMPGWISSIMDFFQTNKTNIGIGLSIGGIVLSFGSGYSIGYNGATTGNVLSAILGVVATAIGGTLLIGGAFGAMIGLGVGLAVTIAGIIIGTNEREVEDELKRRFGDVHLTPKEVQNYIQRMFDMNPISVNLKLAFNASADYERAVSAMEDAFIKSHTASIPLNITLTEEEKTQAINNIDSFVDSINQADKSRQVFLQLILQYDTGSENTAEYMSAFATVDEKAEEYFKQLGEQAKQIIQASFNEHGVLTMDAATEAQNLLNQIAEINSIVEAAQASADMQMIHLKYDFSNFDIETLGLASDEIKKWADERKEELTTIYRDKLAAATEELNKAEWELAHGLITQETYEAIQAAYDEIANGTVLQLQFEQVDIEMNANIAKVAAEAFNDKMSQLSGADISMGMSYLQENIDDWMFSPAMLQNTLYDGVRKSVTGMVDNKTKKAAEKTLKQIQPSAATLQSLYDSYIEAGTKPPEALRVALNDTYQLKAIADDTAGIWYIVGQQMVDSPEFLNAMKNAKLSAEMFTDEMRLGIQSTYDFVYQDGQVLIKNIFDGVEVARMELTPQLEESMNMMGVTLVNSVSDGLDEAAPGVIATTEEVMNDVANTFGQGGGGAKKSFLEGVGISSNDVRKAVLNPVVAEIKGLSLNSYGASAGESFIKGLDGKLRNVKMPTIWVTISAQTDSRALSQAGWDQRLSQPVRMYAEGGFPDMGEIFVAGEAGPEIVANIRGRSQVMNEGQIAASVASGVASANATQNDLLREQNALLRELLDKDSSVVVTTRDIFSGMERSNRRNGYVTVPVSQ